LWEIFQALEPNPQLDACILGHGYCSAEFTCVLHDDWQSLRRELVETLQAKTISDLAGKRRSTEEAADVGDNTEKKV
jgi:DNA-binding IscR family transcriptional regulator